jgi:hypothetical protein
MPAVAAVAADAEVLYYWTAKLMLYFAVVDLSLLAAKFDTFSIKTHTLAPN